MRTKITNLLILINVAVWCYVQYTWGTTTNGDVLAESGAMVGQIVQNDFPHHWWRLITANFLHVGLQHLIGNMVSLWIVGSVLEKLLGSMKFLIFYMFAGVAGSLAVMHLNPMTVSAGASTSLFGLYGAFIAYTVMDKSKLFSIVNPQFVNYIIFTAIYNVVITFTQPGISIPGHIGGLIGGILLAFVIKPRKWC